MIDRGDALAHLPPLLRSELLAEFDKITKNYREHRWEASELDGGRFAEVAYAVLLGYFTGSYPASASKPSNFKNACEAFSGQSYPRANFIHSARVTIPRVLVALYEVRNNRGVGHVGGDVDSNHMDAEFVLHSAQWVLAEFVRMFHGLPVEDATNVVTALVDRTAPMIWEVNDKRRVLDTSISLANRTLLLLYSSSKSIQDKTLADWLEQSRLGNYKRVLTSLHRDKYIEYDLNGFATISPIGVARVEDHLFTK